MTKPHAYTDEEALELFFGHIARIFRYWAQAPNISGAEGMSETEARMEGFLFSLLVMFDGGSMGMPSLAIVPCPHEEDEAFARSQGENWWTGSMLNDTSMHEVFPWAKLRTGEAAELPVTLTKTVWLATVTHKHGSDDYAGASQEEVEAKVAAYCREWALKEKGGFELPIDLDDRSAIDTYFGEIDYEFYDLRHFDVAFPATP